LVDYLFKSTVAREIPRERLGEFFAGYYAVINAAALGLELFVAPRLLRSAGIQRIVLVMPALLLVTSLGFATAGTLVAVLLLRGADGSLRHSVNRVGVELLHLPLDVDSRARLRALSEAGGLRVGQALASLLVLVAVGFGLAGRVLPWVPVVLSLAWLGIALRLEGVYVGRLRHGIEKRFGRTNVPEPKFDRASRRAVRRALRSSVETEVLAGLDAVLARERPELIPVSILEHPSSNVVLKALEANWNLTRSNVASAIARLLDHPNPEVRAAALRLDIAHGAEPDVLVRCAEDESNAVRVTAVVGLARLGGADESRVAAELARTAAGKDAFGLRALSRAAGLLPARKWQALLLRIADAPDARAAALLSMAFAEAPDAAHLPALIALLGRREARANARKALVLLGGPALGALSRALEDPETPAAIRIHLPRTICRFHAPEAAVALQRAFVARPDDAVGFKSLRALGRLRGDDPRLPIDRASLESAALRTIERAVAMTCWRRAVEIARQHLPGMNDACAELLSKALAEEAGRALERTFRVMHILEPTCGFHVVFVATRSGDPDVRARGREMLEHLAPATLKRALLALLDEAPTSARLQRPLGFRLPPECLRALRLVRPRGEPNASFEREALATLSDCLGHAARHPNPLLRSLAARHARRLDRRGPGASCA
ncbi:MAG TPA: hypothetical protein VFZ53_32310, partial [Polyangiaceae bacterium]